MILPLVKIGAPVLRRPCQLISPELVKQKTLKQFVQTMVNTMRKAEGVGLAANQVGQGVQLIVLECKSSRRYPQAPAFPLQIYLNPKITFYSKEKEEDWEGCLSIPDYRGVVPRSKTIIFEGINLKGKKIRKKVSGFEARVFQHEVDHINGFFYVDRMNNLKTWGHLSEFSKLKVQK